MSLRVRKEEGISVLHSPTGREMSTSNSELLWVSSRKNNNTEILLQISLLTISTGM